MGLFNALIDVALTPVRCVDELTKDLTDDKRDEADGMLAIMTFGLSSAVKGVVKTIENVSEDLDK